MTGLLVSVRNAREALAALQGGADIIDIKEPNRGALGAADSSCWREVVAAIEAATSPQNRPPVSVALGELLDLPTDDPLRDRSAVDFQGVTWCKVGLAGCGDESDWEDRWNRLLSQIPEGVQSVAVVYVDWENARAPSPLTTLHAAARANCPAVLFDTYDKAAGDLFAAPTAAPIGILIKTTHQCGAIAVIGGSLKIENVSKALHLEADYLAVRTAVCHQQQRTGEVTSAAVDKFLSAMQATSRLKNEAAN